MKSSQKKPPQKRAKIPAFVLTLTLILFDWTESSSATPTIRSKEIRFEDELVEGLNRRPLDSFNQITEALPGARARLYRKRSGFDDRNEILFEEMRVKP